MSLNTLAANALLQLQGVRACRCAEVVTAPEKQGIRQPGCAAAPHMLGLLFPLTSHITAQVCPTLWSFVWLPLRPTLLPLPAGGAQRKGETGPGLARQGQQFWPV